MEWKIRIEEEKNQRVRIKFYPQFETICFYGEARVKNNEWSVFSKETHEMRITLEELKDMMESIIIRMRKRLLEYENLNKGFGALKWISFQDDD